MLHPCWHFLSPKDSRLTRIQKVDPWRCWEWHVKEEAPIQKIVHCSMKFVRCRLKLFKRYFSFCFIWMLETKAFPPTPNHPPKPTIILQLRHAIFVTCPCFDNAHETFAEAELLLLLTQDDANVDPAMMSFLSQQGLHVVGS